MDVKGGAEVMELNSQKLSPELRKNLTDFAQANMLSLREMAQLYDMMATRESILEQHKSPITQNQKNQRWYTRLPNGKQLVKTKREDLDDAILAYYVNLPEVSKELGQSMTLTAHGNPVLKEVSMPTDIRTLKTIYPRWLELRRYEVGQNTLADDLSYWKKYIVNSGIANIPLNQLRRSQLKAWSCEAVLKYGMKKKYFANVKRTLNSLLDFAVDEEIIEINYLRGIRLNKNLYQPAAFKEEHEEVFTEAEQELVMKEAENDSREHDSAIPLGICVLFLTGLRVGELCALRNCDISGKYLYVRRMMIENQIETADGGLVRNGYQIVEHAKSTAGMRKIFLTTRARKYFEEIKALNQKNGYPCADKDLVFQRKEGMCNQRVFDSRLKKYCNPNHLNLPFVKSCHDIRRSYITHLFDIGVNPDGVRRRAGHESLEMTMKYCKDRKSEEEEEKDGGRSLSLKGI